MSTETTVIGVVPYGNQAWEIQTTTAQGDTRAIIVKGASREEVQGMAAARELASQLRTLVFAASARENVMGDPCRLIECQEDLRRAIRSSLDILEKVG